MSFSLSTESFSKTGALTACWNRSKSATPSSAPKGASQEQVRQVLYENRLEKLPLIDDEGKLAGIRVFRVESLIQRPEYVKWLKESLSKLKRP